MNEKRRDENGGEPRGACAGAGKGRGVGTMIANLVVGGLAAGCLYAMVGIAIVIVLNITDISPISRRAKWRC